MWRWAIPILGIAAIATGIVVFLVVYQVTHPQRTAETLTPQNFLIAYQEVIWPADDGAEIHGWFLAGIRGAPCVILVHGFGHNMSTVLQLALLMRESGYNVLLYNLRAHGQSPHSQSSLGLKETGDLLRAIDYVMTLLPVDRTRLGVWGVSTGAYAALRASENSDRIIALALDSVYPTVDDFLRLRTAETTGIDNALFHVLVRWGFCLYVGVKPSELDATIDFGKILHIQTAFISAVASPELGAMTRAMHQKAQGRSEVVNFSKSRNSILLGVEIQNYDTQLLGWFKQALPIQSGGRD